MGRILWTAAVAVALTLALLASPASAQNVGWGKPDVAPLESGTQVTSYIDSGEKLYEMKWKLTNNDGALTWSMEGRNFETGDKLVTWTESMAAKLTDKGVEPQSWSKESSGAEQMKWTLRYNWAAKTADYTFEDRATGKKEARTIKLPDDALAADAMPFSLRAFPFEKGEGYSEKVRVVNTDSQVMGAELINRGVETRKTPMGEFEAYKLELNITGLIGVVAPKMYFWYTKAEPHTWLGFEGKDGGLTEGRTINALHVYAPVDRLK
ncbi:MAG: hypothetical protein H6684_13330 [Deltaproteobacteria bacterium]|nr:hypothetical protein [Deltaproteobacteria bacterium]